MTSDEIEKLKMDLLDAKENVRYHKQELKEGNNEKNNK